MVNLQPTAPVPFHLLPTASDGRPRMVLRVGVTGHRDLKNSDSAALVDTLAEVFDMIASTVRTVQVSPISQAIYSAAPPVMQLVSPLAEGADRIAAKVALERGWRLATVMPFFQESYERDFDDKTEFRALLARAREDSAVVELDNEYCDDQSRRSPSYLEAGQFLLRHCDLIVGIWNGEPAAGIGGTADVLGKALELKIPVLRIDMANPRRVSLLLEDEQIQPSAVKGISPIVAREVRAILWPPLDSVAVAAARRFFLHEKVSETTAERNYYDRGRFGATPNVALTKVFAVFKKLVELVTPLPLSSEPEPVSAPSMPVNGNFLFDHFQRADHLATTCSNRHRRRILLISAMVALAHICGVTAIVSINDLVKNIFIGFEFAFLSVLTLTFELDRRSQWRERWLDYRLLAEMLREAGLLALIGRGLTFQSVNEHEGDLVPRGRWVPRAFRAITRAAGITGARYDKNYLESVKAFAAEGRLTDHIRYHEGNAARSRMVNHLLKRASQFLFALAFGVVSLEVISRVWQILPNLIEQWLPFLAAALPAFAYAAFAIRAQGEFEILARSSDRMKALLERHRERLRTMSGTGLNSGMLGRELARACEAMRQDVADWVGIFEMKEIEAG